MHGPLHGDLQFEQSKFIEMKRQRQVRQKEVKFQPRHLTSLSGALKSSTLRTAIRKFEGCLQTELSHSRPLR